MLTRGLVLAAALVALTGCTHATSTPTPSSPSSSPSVSATTGSPSTPAASDSPSGESDVGLPAPAPPSSPAPSTAGPLSVTSLPVPAGWRAVATRGGVEQGYLGNGTPAHARDPRRAAYEVMGVGCADVSRASWTDPTAALEVNLVRSGRTGVAEAMVFRSRAQAETWFGLFTRQLLACGSGTSPHVTRASSSATSWTGRRDYGAGEAWSEVAAVTGSTVRLYLLLDPAGTVTPAQQQTLLSQLRSAR